jgi:hypothetical protein
MFLASIQIAGAPASKNQVWKELVEDLVANKIRSKWFCKVRKELVERQLLSSVLTEGTTVVEKRKEIGVQFSQFCFHKHLNLPTNTSADLFRQVKPFGIYPFLLSTPPMLARYALSFILCNFRWIDRAKCKNFPRVCVGCKVNNSAWHVLFECPVFCSEREWFSLRAHRVFDYSAFIVADSHTPRLIAEVCKRVYDHVARLSCS